MDQKEIYRLKNEQATANDRIAELIVALDQQEQLTTQFVAQSKTQSSSEAQ